MRETLKEYTNILNYTPQYAADTRFIKKVSLADFAENGVPESIIITPSSITGIIYYRNKIRNFMRKSGLTVN